jgi:hypothetical protein
VPSLERLILVFLSSPLFLPALTSAQTVGRVTTAQACATFTHEGLSLRAIVTDQAVAIWVGDSDHPATFPFPSGLGPRARSYYENCNLVLNRAENEAAIGVPSFSPAKMATAGKGDSYISLVVARLDLKQIRWGRPLQLAPPQAVLTYYRNDLSLVGYREDSPQLIVVTSDNRSMLIKANDEVVDIQTNLPSVIFFRKSFIDTADNRFWGTCPENRKFFGWPQPCSLASTSLLGPLKAGPSVPSPSLTRQKHVRQWDAPIFYFDTGGTLVFGAGFSVWVANLADGSVRQMTFHRGLHDDAMDGPAALSPDSSAVAFTVARSRLGCCLVDNYINLGERIVVEDLQSAKQIASVIPPKGKSLLGFAVDHRASKTVLVVNWGDGWESKEFTRP